MENFVQQQLSGTIATLEAVSRDPRLLEQLLSAARVTANAFKSGKKLLLAGNGGSAADAQHLAAEFVARMNVSRPALRAIALTTDTSILTAAGNDFGFDEIFKRQIEALADEGDVFMGISTSGASRNVLNAFKECRARKVITVFFTGIRSDAPDAGADFTISVPSTQTQHIQEAHLALYHSFCGVVERHVFGTQHFPDGFAR